MDDSSLDFRFLQQPEGKITRGQLIFRILRRIDWWLLGSVVILSLAGVIMIYSATIQSGNPGYYAGKQLFALSAGLLVALLLLSFNYQIFQQYFSSLYGVIIFLLFCVLLFGKSMRGSRSWFVLGDFAFQPVELIKFLLVLVLAAFLERHKENIARSRQLFQFLILVFLPIGLILLQPDFSSTLVFFPLSLILAYIGGARWQHLLFLASYGFFSLGVPLGETYLRLSPSLRATNWGSFLYAVLTRTSTGVLFFLALCALFWGIWWFMRYWRIYLPRTYPLVLSFLCGISLYSGHLLGIFIQEYQRKRLIAFLNPEIDPLGAGYNIIQSIIALGSGGMIGKGFLAGTQSRLGFLPERHTDFIFSVIGEELGFLGCSLVLGIYFFVVWRSFQIARFSRDRYGLLIAGGVAVIFAFYGIINIGMVMGLMPVTGLPLPFVSYGGSSLFSSFVGIGILLSVHFRRFTY